MTNQAGLHASQKYQCFCKKDRMSICTAGPTWKEQAPCRFSNLSEQTGRCINYRIDLNGHCDNVQAQKNSNIIA